MGSKFSRSNHGADEFKALVPIYEIKLDFYDRVANNNKFWHVAVFDGDGLPETSKQRRYLHIVRRWGRNGTNGQSMVEVEPNKWRAKSYAQDMAQKKQGDGYTAAPSVLELIAREVPEDDA